MLRKSRRPAGGSPAPSAPWTSCATTSTPTSSKRPRKKDGFTAQLAKAQDDLAALTAAKVAVEANLTDVTTKHGDSLAELARWECADKEPWLRPYRPLLPKTADAEALKRAVDAIQAARNQDLGSMRQQMQNQPPAWHPARPTAQTCRRTSFCG